MFGDTHELAENKLLLLYIFECIDHPVSNSHITEIVLENNLLNYFHLQQFLSELVSAEFLNLNRQDKKILYEITSKGKETLEYFESRIAEHKKELVRLYLLTHSEQIKNNIEIRADYQKREDENYLVSCSIANDDIDIIEIKINIKSLEEAKRICSNWSSDASQSYKKILDILHTNQVHVK